MGVGGTPVAVCLEDTGLDHRFGVSPWRYGGRNGALRRVAWLWRRLIRRLGWLGRMGPNLALDDDRNIRRPGATSSPIAATGLPAGE